MGMKAECDLCHKEIGDSMDILEVKLYPSDGRPPRFALGAMVCEPCQKAIGIHDFVHKFKSAGGIDMIQRAQEAEMAQQRAAALATNPAELNQPIPVDPKLAGRIRNAR